MAYENLFNYMAKEHGLNLLQEEMQEIERMVELDKNESNCNLPHVIGRSEQLICPDCDNPYCHTHTDGSYSCEDCGHKWAN